MATIERGDNRAIPHTRGRRCSPSKVDPDADDQPPTISQGAERCFRRRRCVTRKHHQDRRADGPEGTPHASPSRRRRSRPVMMPSCSDAAVEGHERDGGKADGCRRAELGRVKSVINAKPAGGDAEWGV